MSELKPCPFCGEQPELTTYFIKGTANHTNVYASCSCGHKTRSRKGVDGAIADWNTRPIEDALQARIAELTECIGSQMADVYTLKARIAELEEQVWNLNLENERLEEAYWIDETISPDGTLKPSVRKLLERLEKAETDLRLSDDLVKALDNRIAKLEAENETLKTACDILRGDNNLLFKRLMSIETPDDLQSSTIVYRKECEE